MTDTIKTDNSAVIEALEQHIAELEEAMRSEEIYFLKQYEHVYYYEEASEMKTFLKFVLDDENDPIRLENLPFALVAGFVLLAILSLIGWFTGLAFFDTDPPNNFAYLFLGLLILGVFNGVLSFIGLFTLALRAPKDLDNKGGDV